MVRIEIDGLPPSLNQLYAGTHWSVRKRMVDDWHEKIGWALKAFKCPRTLETPVVLSVTQFCKGRVRDADNAVVGAKLVGDTLKEMGYIPDDGPEYVKVVRLQTEKGKQDKLVVVIQPYEPERDT